MEKFTNITATDMDKNCIKMLKLAYCGSTYANAEFNFNHFSHKAYYGSTYVNAEYSFNYFPIKR